MLWAFLASLALLLPTLGRFRLLDADELTHARVALEAAVQGHWFPLTLGGLPWPEKPPLLIWLSAVTMKLLGPTELAVRLWPAQEPELLAHAHPDLPPQHPHLAEHGHGTGHRHRLVIDALHPRWPKAAG